MNETRTIGECIRNQADSKCKDKHFETYIRLLYVDGWVGGKGPPCEKCLEEAKLDYVYKWAEFHGRRLSPGQAATLAKKLVIS